jgi:hypothetical protein
MRAVESITARGHKNIQATNKSTFEITKDTHLTPRGDCIIAVEADKSLSDLSDEFKRILHNNDAKIRITIKVDYKKEEVIAYGNTKLMLASPTSIVVRRSSYVCDRTLAIRANKSAGNLSRSLVAKLKDPKNRVDLELAVDNEDQPSFSRSCTSN